MQEPLIHVLMGLGLTAALALVAGVIISTIQPVTHQRYRVHITGEWYYSTDAIERLPDGGIVFIRHDGVRVEVHGTYEIMDHGVKAEAR